MPPPRRRGAGGQRALDNRAVSKSRISPIHAVGAAAHGGPRSDDLPCRLNGITSHIPRRGGPMCPPVARCGTGTGPIKRYMSVIGGKGRRGPAPAGAFRSATAAKRRLLARRCGPYGGVRNVSINDGRVAGDGDPYIFLLTNTKKYLTNHSFCGIIRTSEESGQNSLPSIFSGGMYVGKNTFCFAECAAPTGPCAEQNSRKKFRKCPQTFPKLFSHVPLGI